MSTNANELNDFKTYLQLEKSLSDNSVEAYVSDVEKLLYFIENHKNIDKLKSVKLPDLQDFTEYLADLEISTRSQARIISGIRAFFRFLVVDGYIENDPSLLLEMPILGTKLPDVLSIEEIDLIENAINLSQNEGHRNKAIIETLYSCGLRVSELINLKVSDLFFDLEFIKVLGKGNKERLIPINKNAIDKINLYIDTYRNHKEIAKGSEDILFINRRGKKLTRVMIFTIVKQLAQKAGITKNISPHTFRHSFATHLVDGGANLVAVKEMLGHESIITTELYTHISKEYLKETVNSFHPRSIKLRIVHTPKSR